MQSLSSRRVCKFRNHARNAITAMLRSSGYEDNKKEVQCSNERLVNATDSSDFTGFDFASLAMKILFGVTSRD